MEVLSIGAPLVAARTGGIPELIAREDHARCTVEAEAGPLAAALERALVEPPAPPRWAVAPADNLDRTLRWHHALANAPAHAPALVATENDDFELVLAAGHEPDPEAMARLVAAARRAEADIVVFGVRGPDGRVAVPLGGPSQLAALAPVMSLGSALVRRGVLAAPAPDAQALDAALAAGALAGRRLLTFPDPLATSVGAPDRADGLVGWLPDSGAMDAGSARAPLTAGLPRDLAEVPQLVALAGAGLERAHAELADAVARVRVLDAERDDVVGVLAARQEELRQAELALRRREEEMTGLLRDLGDARGSAEYYRRQFQGLRSRKVVRVALQIGRVRRLLQG
jgi:hypothetical protein